MDYQTVKSQALAGNITEALFPYLWEYYQAICTKKLVESYEQFIHCFNAYINIPVLMPNHAVLIPVQELMKKLPDIFKHLDTEHEEATEK